MINMNMPMVALAACMALVPFSSSAQCLLSGDGVRGDPVTLTETLIEGTRKADVIDCSDSLKGASKNGPFGMKLGV